MPRSSRCGGEDPLSSSPPPNKPLQPSADTTRTIVVSSPRREHRGNPRVRPRPGVDHASPSRFVSVVAFMTLAFVERPRVHALIAVASLIGIVVYIYEFNPDLTTLERLER